MRYPHTEDSSAAALRRTVSRLPNSGSVTARTQVPGGLSLRCPRCDEWIDAHSVQISFSFDQVAGVTNLYMVNPDMPLRDVVEEIQRALIRRAILRANGVMKRAAEIVGMKYSTFWEMAQRLDVAPPKA